MKWMPAMLAQARGHAIGGTPRPARRIGPAAPTSVARYPSVVTDGPEIVDPWRHTVRFAVRQYELDQYGHVNNAVYLNWAEQVAIDHVEALGYGRDWAIAQGGAWVVREHHVTYHRPVTYGDVVLVTTLPQQLGGVRGTRRTEIRREADGTLMTDALTEWIWVRASDGRPARVPAELLERFSQR